MKIDRQRTFFSLGSAFLIFAIVILTLLPFASDNIVGLAVVLTKMKTAAFYSYLFAFIFYLFSLRYFTWQMVLISINLVFFLLFWFLFVNNL